MDITAKHPRPARSRVTPAAASRTLLLATDLQQSILAELDRSGPNLRNYSPYGVPTSQRPTSAHLGFNGQLRERPTGWYHLGNGHRVYNPVLMRFHSPDGLSPFGKGGINTYAYCEGDPLNFVDPTGRWPAWVADFIQPFATALLHGSATTAYFTGPSQAGIVRQASRISVAGSTASLVAAGFAIAGAPIPQLGNVGTVALAAGAAIRVIHGTVNALKKPGLLNNVKARFKDLIGIGEAPGVVPLERVEIPLESIPIPTVSANVSLTPPRPPPPPPQTSANLIRTQL